MISPLVLFCFQGRLIKQFGELITFFLPIQEPPRSGTLCDFTENSLHRRSSITSCKITLLPLWLNKRYYEQIDGKTNDISDEIPFDLPEGWGIARIGQCIKLLNGRAYKQNELLQQGRYKVLRVGNFFTNSSWYYSDLELEPEKYCYPGDLLYAWSASFGPQIWTGPKTIFHYHIWNVKFSGKLFDKSFLYHFFMYDKDKLQGATTGSTMIHVSMEHMNPRFIPIPPRAEQQRIVAQIESLLKCVDEIDRESETLEKSITLAKQKILDLAIRGKLVPQDPKDEPASELLKKVKAEKEALIKAGKLKRDKHESFIFRGDDNCYYEQLNGKSVKITAEIPFDLPDGWVWSRLRSLGIIVGGGTPSTLNADYWNGEIPWLSPADYHKKYISRGRKNITTDGLAHSSAVLMPSGSILYSSRAPIGYVVIARNAISTNQGFKSLVPAINGLSEFLYYILIGVTPDIKRRATGTTFKEISGAEFGETLVPLPPLREQLRIVQAIEQYDSILGAISK